MLKVQFVGYYLGHYYITEQFHLDKEKFLRRSKYVKTSINEKQCYHMYNGIGQAQLSLLTLLCCEYLVEAHSI